MGEGTSSKSNKFSQEFAKESSKLLKKFDLPKVTAEVIATSLKDAINSLSRDTNNRLKEKVPSREPKTTVDPINNTLGEVTEALKSLPKETGVETSSQLLAGSRLKRECYNSSGFLKPPP